MIHVPAEWAPHRAIWTAWPSAADLWLENLEPAQAEVAAMVRALAGGDRLRVLANGAAAEASAKAAIGDVAEIIPAKFGDIWLRDTGPIFARVQARHGDEEAVALGFSFNGWGGKYDLPHDDEVAGFIAAQAGVALKRQNFILEGGAVEMDGEGTILTTRQCLLNANRNAGWKDHTAEAKLAMALGAKRVLWLDEGLHNDHTDGHVDNLARFVGPAQIVCQAPGKNDPNAKVLDAIARQLETMIDADARQIEVARIPSPGLVVDEGGLPVPASHMNFIIGDKTVVVPIYSDSGDDAVKALAPFFPTRRVLGLSANAILSGGGAFHCITQQEPV